MKRKLKHILIKSGRRWIGKQEYNYKDISNVTFKIPHTKTIIENMELYDYHKTKGFSWITDFESYLSVIPNIPKDKQSFGIWWIIGTILQKLGVDYKIFEEWTIQAYTGNLDEVVKEWRNTK